jgi:hypothetical protein
MVEAETQPQSKKYRSSFTRQEASSRLLKFFTDLINSFKPDFNFFMSWYPLKTAELFMPVDKQDFIPH